MEGTEKQSRKHPINSEQKYIRLQITGMSFGLAIPVMGILAGMYGFERIVPQIAVLMVMVGVAIFCMGYVGRQELAEQRRKDQLR